MAHGRMQAIGLNIVEQTLSLRATAKLHDWQVCWKNPLSVSPLATTAQHADESAGAQVESAE